MEYGMNDPAQRQLLMSGLQYMGKTTFLGIFYLALLEEPKDLRLTSYQDDREYLNEIAGRLMSCTEAVHTEMDEHRELSLSLEIKDSGEPVALKIPDLSGETWEAAVVERYWSQE